MPRQLAVMVAVLMAAPLAATPASADRRILIFDPVGDVAPGIDPAALGEGARSAAAKAWTTARVLTGLNLRILLRSANVDLAACRGQVGCELDAARALGAELALVGTLRRERGRAVLEWAAYDVSRATKLGQSSVQAPADDASPLMRSSAAAAIAALSDALGAAPPPAVAARPPAPDAGAPTRVGSSGIASGVGRKAAAPDGGAAVASRPPEVDAGTRVAVTRAPDAGAAVVTLPPEIDAGTKVAVTRAPDAGAAMVTLPPEIDAGTRVEVSSAPDAGAAVVTLPPEVDAGTRVEVTSAPDAGAAVVSLPPEVDAGTVAALPGAPDAGSAAVATKPSAPSASKPPPTGYLQLFARGPDGKALLGATVAVDGKPVGATPFSGPVAAGEHGVAVVSADGVAFKKVVVAADSVQQVELSIQGEAGAASAAEPAKAQGRRPATLYIEGGGGVVFGTKPRDFDGEDNPGNAFRGGLGIYAGNFAAGATLGFTGFKSRFYNPLPAASDQTGREFLAGGATVAYFPAPFLVLRLELEAGALKYTPNPTVYPLEIFAAGARLSIGVEGLIGDHLLLGIEAGADALYFDNPAAGIDAGGAISLRLAILL